MADQINYLLGFGERLTEKIEAPRKIAKKRHPYTFNEARQRLTPQLRKAVKDIEQLPAAACPNDESIAAVTLHPAYLAKTFFPAGLLRSVGLESIGSRSRHLVPEKGAKFSKQKEGTAIRKEAEPIPSATADLFVAGSRRTFHRWAESLAEW